MELQISFRVIKKEMLAVTSAITFGMVEVRKATGDGDWREIDCKLETTS